MCVGGAQAGMIRRGTRQAAGEGRRQNGRSDNQGKGKRKRKGTGTGKRELIDAS